MNSLGVVEFNSYGHGLATLQEIYSKAEIEVLEIIPVCGGLTLILSGPATKMNETLKPLPPEDRENMIIVESYDQMVLRALYSLENSPVKTNLLILEGTFAGDLLAQAQRAATEKIAIVDLKVPRGAARAGYLLLTHESEKSLDAFRSKIGDGLTRVTMIRNVADGFKKYFDLVPKA